MKKVLLALCVIALCAATGASAATTPTKAKVPPNPCGTTITPALIKQLTGVKVFAFKSYYTKDSGSFACDFGSPEAIHNAIEVTLARYPKGSTNALSFFTMIKKTGLRNSANADECWANEQLIYSDPLPEDCTWTPVAGPWKSAAVIANQMFIRFPNSVMTLMTGGTKNANPGVDKPTKRTFTYDQMIAIAKAAAARVSP